MKKHTKVVLSRIVASALVVGAMFSNVIADPALDTAPAAVEEVADSVVTPGGVSVGNGDEATEETTVVEDVTEETTANTAVMLQKLLKSVWITHLTLEMVVLFLLTHLTMVMQR